MKLVERCLKLILDTHMIPVEEKRVFFKHLHQNFGQTALCLSGGATFAYVIDLCSFPSFLHMAQILPLWSGKGAIGCKSSTAGNYRNVRGGTCGSSAMYQDKYRTERASGTRTGNKDHSLS